MLCFLKKVTEHFNSFFPTSEEKRPTQFFAQTENEILTSSIAILYHLKDTDALYCNICTICCNCKLFVPTHLKNGEELGIRESSSFFYFPRQIRYHKQSTE